MAFARTTEFEQVICNLLSNGLSTTSLCSDG